MPPKEYVKFNEAAENAAAIEVQCKQKAPTNNKPLTSHYNKVQPADSLCDSTSSFNIITHSCTTYDSMYRQTIYAGFTTENV